MRTDEIYLPDVVGKGYATFWNFKGRYRVCKGSRASKKSKTTALNFIVRMMQYPAANLLVVRKSYATLQNSCFTELKWAINRLNVAKFWKIRLSPLEMTYIPTGQKILFRGLDDPLKITSMTVEVGALCWLWIEEAYEVTDEAAFDMLDESIRGVVPEGLFKQITLTLNPWSDKHWIKRRFFDVEDDPNILAMTTNYLCNEWLDAADREKFETMKRNNPKRYLVAGLGNWGVVDGQVYENWKDNVDFDINEIRARRGVYEIYGLDFGYVNDPTALFCALINPERKLIWVFDELYEYKLTNEKIAERLREKGYERKRIFADCAEMKSIDRLVELGAVNVKPCRKGRDSVNNGIDFLQDYFIYVHPRCVHFVEELNLYTWKTDTKTGAKLNEPIDAYNHLMDAMRYAAEEYIGGARFSFE